MTAIPPPMRDRMPGRYHDQCPTCRTHRSYGPDCAGGPIGRKKRRAVEQAEVRRYIAENEEST